MTGGETELLPVLGHTESASSVKLTRNAKGETQVETKIYSEDNTPAGIAAAVAQAQTVYDALVARYCGTRVA